MTITTIAFPTLARPAPSEFYFRPVPNRVVQKAPQNNQADIVEFVGDEWECRFVYRNLLFPDRAAIAAWEKRVHLNGGQFFASHPMYANPRGTARNTGTQTVSAAAQFATSITLNGLTPGATLLADDQLEIGIGLLVSITDTLLTVTGGGTVVANIFPMLRIAVAGGTTFSLAAPRAKFRFADTPEPIPTLPGPGNGGHGDVTIAGIEDFHT